MNTSVQVLREQYIFASNTVSGVTTSTPVRMQGNKVVLAVTVVNLDPGSGTLDLQVEGSYDGLSWSGIGSGVSFSSFGYDDEAIASVDVAWVRVRVEGVGAGASPNELNGIVDAYLAFSEQ
ncbi:MAG: hypothetical protein R3C29_17850 [Dehalococcoidia bacterium]